MAESEQPNGVSLAETPFAINEVSFSKEESPNFEQNNHILQLIEYASTLSREEGVPPELNYTSSPIFANTKNTNTFRDSVEQHYRASIAQSSDVSKSKQTSFIERPSYSKPAKKLIQSNDHTRATKLIQAEKMSEK